MKRLFAIVILALVLVSSSQSMSINAAIQATIDGDTVWYAPVKVYQYLAWNRAALPGSPFNSATNIPHGTIDQLTNVVTQSTDEWIASVNGNPFTLNKLYVSITALKEALKPALQAKSAEAAAIAALDLVYADSVDEIGSVLSVSESELDYGSSTTELTFDITNPGIGILKWDVASSLPTKVTVDSASGETQAETDTVTVTVSRAGVPAGTYNPTVTVSTSVSEHVVTLNIVVE